MPAVFDILKPADPLPLVFDSPHSGTVYPADFRPTCTPADLQKTEDRFVDKLFITAPGHGGYLLRAHFPRAYIDANRAIDDIDPGLLEGEWPLGETNPTARSDAGIGLIRRLAAPGVPVYDAPLSAENIIHRIETYYKPYHKALETLLNEAHYNFGQVYHINCHSMPDSAAIPKRHVRFTGNRVRHSDFVLGNQDGVTCGTGFMHTLRDFLRKAGYTVTINDPFKGVELIGRHAQPARGRHSLQIEINKSLYMNEATGEATDNFETLRIDIDRMIAHAAGYVRAQLVDLAAD